MPLVSHCKNAAMTLACSTSSSSAIAKKSAFDGVGLRVTVLWFCVSRTQRGLAPEKTRNVEHLCFLSSAKREKIGDKSMLDVALFQSKNAKT